jgi:hypothetical protein
MIAAATPTMVATRRKNRLPWSAAIASGRWLALWRSSRTSQMAPVPSRSAWANGGMAAVTSTKRRYGFTAARG